jgi:hypothetical protein
VSNTSQEPVLVDPVAELIDRGAAASVAEAEEIYLNAHLHDVLDLVASNLDDETFRAHPLIALLLARGSRAWEDSLR